jgi:protein ImuB
VTVTRTLVAWCPDWPVVALGPEEGTPVAVLAAGRVLACSAAARAEGVERGLRRRQAESRCSGLVVAEHDPGCDARAFEPVAAAVEAFTPAVEIVRPGVCALPTRGPSRYFGGDEALAGRVAAAVAPLAPGCRVGVADGRFAAEQAARRALVVPPGGSPAFLAPLPLAALEAPDLADLLGRLGVRTLGDLAALPARSVLARFGPEGARAHRLAGGRDERPPAARRPPPDLAVEAGFDPPADRIEAAAFAARGLAARLEGDLAARGLAAARIAVEVETDHGERLRRLWRVEGDGPALAQRVRWQLEAWVLHHPQLGPVSRLRLVPDEVGPARGSQLGFWGGDRAAAERATAGLVRVQSRLGSEAVRTAVPAGGRGPADQVRLVVWGDAPPAAAPPTAPAPPWPGRVPPPAPATVHSDPAPAEVVDGSGEPVGVGGRGLPTAPPARVSVAGEPWSGVVAWAGPWPVDERWWDPAAHRRRARWQVVTAEGTALLLALEGGRWWVEATYD